MHYANVKRTAFVFVVDGNGVGRVADRRYTYLVGAVLAEVGTRRLDRHEIRACRKARRGERTRPQPLTRRRTTKKTTTENEGKRRQQGVGGERGISAKGLHVRQTDQIDHDVDHLSLIHI